MQQVTFDKTGTLTFGTPEVTAVYSVEGTEKTLYALTAGAELRSEHPLGKAVVRGFEKGGGTPPEPEHFTMLPGRGVEAEVEGRRIVAGNLELLAERGVDCTALTGAKTYLDQGCTVVYVAADGRPAGFLALADTVRPDAADTIRQVQKAGVTPVLLTGDHENAARHIAGQLGIDVFQAGCLPEDKLAWIDRAE